MVLTWPAAIALGFLVPTFVAGGSHSLAFGRSRVIVTYLVRAALGQATSCERI